MKRHQVLQNGQLALFSMRQGSSPGLVLMSMFHFSFFDFSKSQVEFFKHQIDHPRYLFAGMSGLFCNYR